MGKQAASRGGPGTPAARVELTSYGDGSNSEVSLLANVETNSISVGRGQDVGERRLIQASCGCNLG